MKRHYDFSKAERGKFYRKGARVRLPIYLDGQLQKRLERIAQKILDAWERIDQSLREQVVERVADDILRRWQHNLE